MQGYDLKLREALALLAANASDQVGLLSPGCIICELLGDYDIAYKSYLENSQHLTGETKVIFANLNAIIQKLPDEDCQCFDNELLFRPSWDEVRGAAKRVLATLNWCDDLPVEFMETEPGVWRRAEARRQGN